MRQRYLSILCCLIYLTIAPVLGRPHQHEHSDGLKAQRDCVACAWQATATGAAPAIAAVLVVTILLHLLVMPHALLLPATFYFPSAGRAPPALAA
jgi:hypothetical protein